MPADTIEDEIEAHDAVIAALIHLPATATARDVAVTRELALASLKRQRLADAAPLLYHAIPLRITDRGLVQDRAFAATVITVGSAPTSHILVPDAAPLHATLFRDRQGDVWVMNIEGTNVLLQPKRNAKHAMPVLQTAVVAPGDTVTIASTSLLLLNR